ncbi:glutathione peroxidase [Denitromonas iodatirespirans]|uniref:Glutathione peroxidase n=1 Tax=Denitromonas iodatirespirans TaxID=2795389 RepID=A0A944H5W6_DENI1|nr:glutathione peroxidase [Denitromonas iodatirespirans]MBT0959543.1 glutathione peroxidase [Denitromonas iodatirespirans]
MLRRTLFPALIALLATLLPATAPAGEASAGLFAHELRRLHSGEVVRLADRFAGQPVLVVNTASHCGFTKQFHALEAIHQRYKERGLRVVGFASDDFDQEADDEAKAAEVCFVNFGVTFDMFAPIHVRGTGAHPLFGELARRSEAPAWNFHKYLVDRDGRVVATFPSRVEPDAAQVRAAIERML